MVKYFSDRETFQRVQSLQRFQELTQHAPPDHLFHYTSSAGLLGIVSSKQMWLSDSQSLNDEKELKYFKDIVENAAHNICNNYASKALSEPVKNLVKILGDYAHVVTGGIFVLSFSEHRDQLSQWRAYSDGSPGYALGVPGPRLAQVADEEGFFLCKCCYDHGTAYQAALSLLHYFADSFLEGDDLTLDEQSVRHEFGRMVNIIAPLFKHRSFSEEAEWRAYGFLSWQDSRLEFRAASGEIVPYVTFPLDRLKERLEGKMPDVFLLISGPGQRYNPTAGQGIFWKYLNCSVTVEGSEAPYRAK